MLGHRTPSYGESRCPFWWGYVVLTRFSLALEFGLGVPPLNNNVGSHLTVVVPAQEQNSLS